LRLAVGEAVGARAFVGEVCRLVSGVTRGSGGAIEGRIDRRTCEGLASGDAISTSGTSVNAELSASELSGGDEDGGSVATEADFATARRVDERAGALP
jgi:hypothetical protein